MLINYNDNLCNCCYISKDAKDAPRPDSLLIIRPLKVLMFLTARSSAVATFSLNPTSERLKMNC